MVLQRGIPVKIWGTANPEKEVIIKFAEQEKKITSDEKGNWMVLLDAMAENSAPQKLEISSDDQILKFENVLVGDVWVCSGQSNMAWTVNSSNNPQEEINSANYPQIRFFNVSRKTSGEPIKTLDGEWMVCSPKTVGDFSAVGYFFGRKLNRILNVPIGLINSSWGGTPVEAWTTFNTLQNDSAFLPIVNRYKADLDSEAMKEYKKRLAEWEKIMLVEKRTKG